MAHDLTEPSAWVRRFAARIPVGAHVLDLACGRGRHARWLAAAGCSVLAVDRDAEALATLAGVSGIETRALDLEAGHWPLAGTCFDAIVVANYLHRPILPAIVGALAPGGILIYETFARGNERFGRPSNPDFLLRPGELLEAVRGLRVLAYEDLEVDDPRPACVQRVCALRAGADRAGHGASPMR